jgi:GT2 family glycosyltransferase
MKEQMRQSTKSQGNAVIAVVIPSYRVRESILGVLEAIGQEVDLIYVVDDCCPEASGAFVTNSTCDPRVHVIQNATNQGVGGATLVGMKRACLEGADVIVKIDGDGQMDPSMISHFVDVILAGEADYAKGNRFFDVGTVASMPVSRMIGNAALSFMAKISTGYWHTFDPTNGYIAIHASVADLLPFDKIAKRYFFESDMLFRLNVLSARVIDIPMHSHYAAEESNLSPVREIPRFTAAHARNLWKRVVYNYFIRNFSIASIELIFGLFLTFFGVGFGIWNWSSETPATAGTVMLAALPIIVGIQLLLSFLNFDVQAVPQTALHIRLKRSARVLKPLRHAASAK